MLTENLFTNLTKSLRTGFTADQIVLALNRILAEGVIRDEYLPFLERAKGQLEQVKDGFDWLKKPSVDSRSTENAFFFNRAVSALYMRVRTPKEFNDHVTELIVICKSLINKEKVAEGRINELIDYFRQISSTELDNSREIFTSRTEFETLRP